MNKPETNSIDYLKKDESKQSRDPEDWETAFIRYNENSDFLFFCVCIIDNKSTKSTSFLRKNPKWSTNTNNTLSYY